MGLKYKRYDNFLFREDEKGQLNLLQDGKFIPYDEDDNFDVKMMGTPMDEAEANKWVQSEMKRPQTA